jgi:glutamine synthetase
MRTIDEGKPLEADTAGVVAGAMKKWAIGKGATHFTHWFQPMTGITAEKHESFMTLAEKGGVIMEFDGRELIKGESDASSFPTGGIRLTFEARGYTAWDPTSYAFIKNNTLCIPTAFCSYSGEALDKKTPLLRSMQAIDREALRMVRIFEQNDKHNDGYKHVKKVTTTVGAEQEYFLIDKDLFDARPDLIYCGRTLFGARPAKGQEREYHYYGAIKPRVSAFMKELDEELWKLGVPAKTRHNETAPSQHELVPIHTTANIATDHNQLIMEMMKLIANKHNLVCLLHEKPFEGVNGSGKHNNWSICTDTGFNLLEPGDTPRENAQFLTFLCAVIAAVDEYQDLLRVAIASAGNDLRLGSGEAPTAIVSIFIGDELEEVFKSIENDAEGNAKNDTLYNKKAKDGLYIGADVLPRIPLDSTDRNRTSPFAFTGNKFEFRMLGSSFSVADANITINTIVAEVLSRFADELEQSISFEDTLARIIKRTVINHRRIIFNGNNYSKEWAEEAARRGLLNLPTTKEALPYYTLPKNIDLFERHGVYSKAEILSRHEIKRDMYEKTIQIEALTMCEMTNRGIIPSVAAYINQVKDTPFTELTTKLTTLSQELYRNLEALEQALVNPTSNETELETELLERMQKLRQTADALEKITCRNLWAYPSYGELLYSVY